MLKPEVMNRLQLATDDVCGEIIAMGKRSATVQWDDGRCHNVLLSNLELADKKPMATTYTPEYTDALRVERAALLVAANEQVKAAWGVNA
jgi:hypothetical protein